MTAPQRACKLKVRKFIASHAVFMRIQNILLDRAKAKGSFQPGEPAFYSGSSESSFGGSADARSGDAPRDATTRSASATFSSAAASVQVSAFSPKGTPS